MTFKISIISLTNNYIHNRLKYGVSIVTQSAITNTGNFEAIY